MDNVDNAATGSDSVAAENRGIGAAAPGTQVNVPDAFVTSLTPRPDLRPSMDPKAAILSDVQHRFTYHAPKGDQADRYTRMRDRFRDLAENIVLNTPVSREQATALTLLDQASMMANAAIARNE